MIYSALTATAEKLNTYIRGRFSLSEDKVLLSNIVNQDGTVAITESDRIIMTLVNLQHETVTGRVSSNPAVNKPINLNLHILFSAYFSEGNYAEALKSLSAVISFFQGSNVLNHQNTPDLDVEIEKLVFEIVNQDFQAQSHMWGMLGGKYLPSVLYKVRMISIQEGNLRGDFVPFSGLANNIQL